MPSDSTMPTDSDNNEHASPPPSAPRYSLRPVSVAPRPRSVAPAPTAKQPVRSVAPRTVPPLPPTRKASLAPPPSTPRSEGPSDSVAASQLELPAIPSLSPAALEEVLGPTSVTPEWFDPAADTLRPNHIDTPLASPSPLARLRRPKPLRALIAVGIAASIGLIWLVGSTPSAPATVAALPQARPEAAPSPAPAAPAPPAVANDNSADLADSFKAALAGTPVAAPATPATTTSATTIPVTVRVSPSDALIFKSDRRLGKGNVTVNVTPGNKITLVAQRDGYMPRSMVLDGNYNSVNITLKRSPASRAATPPSTRTAAKSAPLRTVKAH